MTDITVLPDPCPLPETQKKKGLDQKQRLIYAPMSDVGGMLYDKDAVYLDFQHTNFTRLEQKRDKGDDPAGEEQLEQGIAMVQSLQGAR